jgi:flagellar motility protein MotE (MotC chaperone)
MKPVDAAAMLNSVDLQVAVMVLATMKARNAAQIMAKMTPDRVQAVSKIILERSKLPGDQNQVVVTVN